MQLFIKKIRKEQKIVGKNILCLMLYLLKLRSRRFHLRMSERKRDKEPTCDSKSTMIHDFFLLVDHQSDVEFGIRVRTHQI
jgi:hypothetical protein